MTSDLLYRPGYPQVDRKIVTNKIVYFQLMDLPKQYDSMPTAYGTSNSIQYKAHARRSWIDNLVAWKYFANSALELIWTRKCLTWIDYRHREDCNFQSETQLQLTLTEELFR